MAIYIEHIYSKEHSSGSTSRSALPRTSRYTN